MRKSPAGVAGQAHQLRRLLTPTPFTSAPIQWGKVHAVHSAPPSVDVYLDGITQSSGFTATKTLTPKIRFPTGYQPQVGDIVQVSRGTGGNSTDRVAFPPMAGGSNTLPVHVAAAAGAPTTGTWIKGSQYLDSNDVLYVCTASGTPGTWAAVKGQVLGATSYDPATRADTVIGGTKAILSTSIGVSFTAPPGGRVLVRWDCFAVLSGTACNIGLMTSGSSTQYGAAVDSQLPPNSQGRVHYEGEVTGLTPGTTYSMYAAACTHGTSTTFYYGGGGVITNFTSNQGPATVVAVTA